MTFANEMNGGSDQRVLECGPGYTRNPCTGPRANWVMPAEIYRESVLRNGSYASIGFLYFLMKKYLQSIR
jgi:hypothetical protein